MKAVIVCGSRNWKGPRGLIWAELEKRCPDIVIHGDCKGADTIAGEWADYYNSQALAMPAQWERHGKAAGPLRNREMAKVLDSLRTSGYEVEVLAFPLGVSVGTRGMISIATHFGFLVTVFE